jgi:phosphopantothenoylcysteine decarboxylase/phosphopantothenate--cysteine ligase
MKVVLGVTGSIAAYKACELVRMFVKNGHEVRVVMTDAAKEFVTPLTFRTLSRNPVYSAQFGEIASWEPEHI